MFSAPFRRRDDALANKPPGTGIIAIALRQPGVGVFLSACMILPLLRCRCAHFIHIQEAYAILIKLQTECTDTGHCPSGFQTAPVLICGDKSLLPFLSLPTQ